MVGAAGSFVVRELLQMQSAGVFIVTSSLDRSGSKLLLRASRRGTRRIPIWFSCTGSWCPYFSTCNRSDRVGPSAETDQKDAVADLIKGNDRGVAIGDVPGDA